MFVWEFGANQQAVSNVSVVDWWKGNVVWAGLRALIIDRVLSICLSFIFSFTWPSLIESSNWEIAAEISVGHENNSSPTEVVCASLQQPAGGASNRALN